MKLFHTLYSASLYIVVPYDKHREIFHRKSTSSAILRVNDVGIFYIKHNLKATLVGKNNI
jgi:hypothetical protein